MTVSCVGIAVKVSDMVSDSIVTGVDWILGGRNDGDSGLQRTQSRMTLSGRRGSEELRGSLGGVAVGAVAAVGVATVAALEMVSGGEDGVRTFDVKVVRLERRAALRRGFADRLFGWLTRRI